MVDLMTDTNALQKLEFKTSSEITQSNFLEGKSQAFHVINIYEIVFY